MEEKTVRKTNQVLVKRGHGNCHHSKTHGIHSNLTQSISQKAYSSILFTIEHWAIQRLDTCIFMPQENKKKRLYYFLRMRMNVKGNILSTKKLICE